MAPPAPIRPGARIATSPSPFAHIELATRARQAAVASAPPETEPLPRRMPGQTAIVDMMDRRLDSWEFPVRPPRPEVLLKVAEVARIIRKSRTSAGRLVRNGAIPSVMIGRSRLVRSSDLDAYLAALPVTVPRTPQARGPAPG